MSKCREEFEKYCHQLAINPEGLYAEDIYRHYRFAWNARGEVDYAKADANYADDFVLQAIEQEDEK